MRSPSWSAALAAALAVPHHGLVQGLLPALLPSQAAQVLLHRLSSTDGTQGSLHFEAVTVSVLPWAWNRMEEEQKKRLFQNSHICKMGYFWIQALDLQTCATTKVRWNSLHTLKTLLKKQPYTFYFFSKSVTKWGLESGNIVFIMIPSVFKE